MSRIVCFGDSNTFGYDPRNFFGSQYDNPWPELLSSGDNTIINEGQNGREIPSTPGEFGSFQQLVLYTKAEKIQIMLGTNDLLSHRHFLAEDVGHRMQVYLETAVLPLFSSADILLVTPPAMQQGSWVTENRLLIESRRLSSVYKEVSYHLEVSYADACEWNIPLAFDGVHFTEDGHRYFAEQIQNYL